MSLKQASKKTSTLRDGALDVCMVSMNVIFVILMFSITELSQLFPRELPADVLGGYHDSRHKHADRDIVFMVLAATNCVPRLRCTW